MYNKCDDCTFHTIKSGDTLYSLSKMYNVPLIAILKANPDVEIFNLQVGSRICIPEKMNIRMQAVREFAYVIKPGESLTDIMEKFNVDWDDIIKHNKMKDLLLKPGITIVLPLDPPEE